MGRDECCIRLEGGDVLEIYAFHATFTQKGYFVSAIVQRTM